MCVDFGQSGNIVVKCKCIKILYIAMTLLTLKDAFTEFLNHNLTI